MTLGNSPLIDLRQPSGRHLWCWDYSVEYSYDGFWDMFIKHTPSEGCNKEMLDLARTRARRRFGDGWPIHVIKPAHQVEEIDYPPVRVTAEFTSLTLSKREGDLPLSSLVVVWFQKMSSPVPDEAGQAELEGLDWEALAVQHTPSSGPLVWTRSPDEKIDFVKNWAMYEEIFDRIAQQARLWNKQEM